MQRRVGEGDAILVEIVADTDLSAESITAAVKIHLVVLVVASLHHDGHVQVGIADSIDDTNLETEVRQRHHDAVYLVAVFAELFTNLQSVLAGLDATAACRRSILR